MSEYVTDRSYDYFDLGEESDQEGAESSEDEIDIILHGTPEQRRRLCQSHAREQRQKKVGRSGNAKSRQLENGHQSSSEDEFEKEMNAELDRTVSMLEKSRGSKPAAGLSTEPSVHSSVSTGTTQSSSSAAKGLSKTEMFYSDIYFDSDDEDNYEGEGESRKLRHHSRPSNDDLLYDPDMDDEDQRWVDHQRRQHRSVVDHSNNRQSGSSVEAGQKSNRGGKKRTAAMAVTPKSDAVLDCPACMTTLCIDCQRHDVYPNQYRAMFVMNCKTNLTELLSVPEPVAKKKAKKSKKSQGHASEESVGSVEEGGNSVSSTDQFHPVMCEECDTVVGVVDMEEVYHFFNVLVSQA